MDERLANLESMATEEREKNDELRDLMKQVLNETRAAGKESKSDRALTIEKLGDLEKRVITLESGNTAKGDYSFKEQHKGEIQSQTKHKNPQHERNSHRRKSVTAPRKLTKPNKSNNGKHGNGRNVQTRKTAHNSLGLLPPDPGLLQHNRDGRKNPKYSEKSRTEQEL